MKSTILIIIEINLFRSVVILNNVVLFFKLFLLNVLISKFKFSHKDVKN